MDSDASSLIPCFLPSKYFVTFNPVEFIFEFTLLRLTLLTSFCHQISLTSEYLTVKELNEIFILRKDS